METKLYGKRDMSKITDYFDMHLKAIAKEQLFSKGSVARELAYRDYEIDRLKEEPASSGSQDSTCTISELSREELDDEFIVAMQEIHPKFKDLLNCSGIDNLCNLPDELLADYLVVQLINLRKHTTYGRELVEPEEAENEE